MPSFAVSFTDAHAVACYFFQYLDKTLSKTSLQWKTNWTLLTDFGSIVNYANIMGLEEDTRISGNQFSQLALVFYVTYLAFEFPTGFLMQILPTAKYLGANVICWGLMVACTAAANDWAALVSLRVLLGCFESAVAPALILLTSMWYKTSEQPRRVGFWYLGTGTAKIVGAITSFGFQHYIGQTFKSWQIMFLVYGLLTIVVGILVVCFMPDNPMTSRLSDSEKKWAIARLRENRTGIENKHFKAYQARECFRDPQTWIIALTIISSNIPNGFVSTYQATVIKGFGFTSKVSSLMSIPSGAVECVGIIGGGWFAGKFNMRGPFVIAFLSLGFLGSCLMAFLPSEGYVAGKMVGNYLASFIGPSLPLMYSYSAANYAGHTKKVAMNAILLISFCESCISPCLSAVTDLPPFFFCSQVLVTSLGP